MIFNIDIQLEFKVNKHISKLGMLTTVPQCHFEPEFPASYILILAAVIKRVSQGIPK